MTEHAWDSVRYAVVDVEGNGHQPPDLVEAAVVPIADGAIGAARTWLIKPPRPITAMARRFHKISDADVADAPPVAAVEQEIRAALDGAVIVAHNAHIDVRVLRRELPGWESLDVIDTLKLAKTASARPGLLQARGAGGGVRARREPARAPAAAPR